MELVKEVVKRNGSREPLRLDKIITRIKKQCEGLDSRFIDYNRVALIVFNGLFDGVSSHQIDILAADSAATLSIYHPEYSLLAAKIAVSALHKETSSSFTKTMKQLSDTGILNPIVYETALKYRTEIEEAIDYDLDYKFDYFGFRTVEKTYLLRVNDKIVERPQHLYMRVAIGIWAGSGDNELENILETYRLMSRHIFTHASPTLFNSGTNLNNLSSCYLLYMPDSISGIYKTFSDSAYISKVGGGIGISITDIRAKDALIKGTNGKTDGIIPMLRVLNETARYVNQSGKRKGSFAVYLEPWHDDIFDFLDIRKPQGQEHLRARDLFPAIWTPDLFMERVNEDGDWYLFSPDEAPNLHNVYGEEFESLYNQYVSEGKYRRKVKAREIWLKITEAQIETGLPYILYKDSINKKSNQKNVGTIKSSNLCTEITEYTDKDQIAVCNLASVSLPKFIVNGEFDHQELRKVVHRMVINLNRVIDINYYPVPETSFSNNKHRPIGIGVQGLADTFALLKYPFDSSEAKELNKEIFETIYFASLEASIEEAKKYGPYETFMGSPASQGILQFDMWKDRTVGPKEGKMVILTESDVKLSGRWNFDALRDEIKKHGLRNSLLVAPMPTATTSQVFGNTESFEPPRTNIYSRRTLSGEFVVTNKHLVADLVALDLWNEDTRIDIIKNEGSIQNIAYIPEDIRARYKTTFEIKSRDIIDMAADRGAFICQSQSMNLYYQNVNYGKVTSALMYGWLKGLKTGVYYSHTQIISTANKGLGIDIDKLNRPSTTQAPVSIKSERDRLEEAISELACSLDNPEACVACSS